MSAFDEFEVCRNLLESLQTGLCVVDTHKRIVFWSDGAERISGLLRHQIVGRSCVAEALLHRRHTGCEFCAEQCALALAIKTAKPVETSGFLHHKSGYEVPARIRAVPVRNPRGSTFTKQTYIDALKTMYDLLNRARKEGLVALEADVEEPAKSPVFSKNETFLNNHHVLDFVCDSLRMAMTGFDALEPDQMLDLDMEVQHRDATQPTTALSTMADSLPGLGIVAAVLGVVITMGALGGPPEEIGHKVAAALVPTFLGVLLCYGLVGPVASNMTKAAEEEHAFLYVMRVLIVSFLKGTTPIMAVEVARRAVPGHVRPSFKELEQACRGGGADTAAAAASAAS